MAKKKRSQPPKMGRHETLCNQAKAAINEVYSDTLVSRSETLESLFDIREEINILIEAITEDMRAEAHEEPDDEEDMHDM